MIETARLFLCPPSDSNIIKLENLWRSAEVRKYLGGVLHRDAARKKTAELQRHWYSYGFGQWMILKRTSLEVIGVCGLHYSEDGLELSYMFYPQFWRQGFAQEAANASISHGFETLEEQKIISITQKVNASSMRLLENIGMIHVNDFYRFDALQCLFEIQKASIEN